MKSAAAPQSIDEYIAMFPREIQEILSKIRRTVREAAPEAKEAIKYRLPTLVQNGNLVHFGAFKSHIGFYAMPSGNERFRKQLAAYEGGRGSVQFPLDRPIPYGLIGQIVKFKVKESRARAAEKKKP